MNDSDQDFVDLCSKLLKRSRKKGVEPKRRRVDQQISCQTSDGDQRGNEESSGSQLVQSEPQQVTENTGKVVHDSGDTVLTSTQTTGPGLGTKDKLLSRMQQFKRADLPKMMHDVDHVREPYPPLSEILHSSTSEQHLRTHDSDEVLAMQLQHQLDHEVAEVHTPDLAAEGLFFCHICQRDLSHMTPERRTQHINRCLDDSEHQMAPPPPPPPPRPPPPSVPDCPICGKKFKSHKSRSVHLKRCSAAMGVNPADLLQALQRQAEETQSDVTDAITQTGGAKRKGVTKAGAGARKKPRKKAEPLDENTMVALALSSSLLEQEREQQCAARTQSMASDSSKTPVLKWRPDAGNGRGKRKKGTVPRPLPILLIQDADAALMRLQERVSALLLRSRAPSPPTPTCCPSTLSALSDAAPLWQKSALSGHTASVFNFFVPELKDFITPWESAQTPACSSTPSTPTMGDLPANSQALQDLVELSEMAHGDSTAPVPDKNTSLSTDLQLSGFFLDETTYLCVSGGPLAMTHSDTDDLQSQARRTLCQPGASEESRSHLSVALSTLASNLSSMVNNPQLSDWQLQVDSGQVFYAHSFMIYARCPLLAEMIHESGFGVHEEGIPTAQRVLINDVPGQAVLVLLQYLYTARFSYPASLRPHVLELASRFDLQELRQLCELHVDEASTQNADEAATSHLDYLSNDTDKNLTALFNSMWSHEDDTDREGGDESRLEKAAGGTSGDGDLHEELVNEEELDEIYEFAATQRKRDEERPSTGESEGDDTEMTSKLIEPRETPGRCSDRSPQPESESLPDHSLDSSYNRLFSDSEGVYKEEEQPSICPHSSTSPRAQTHHAPLFKLSGRTLLQSSASLGSDISPNGSNLPIPGVSPDRDGECSPMRVTEIATVAQESPKQDTPLEPQSPVSGSICVPLLFNSSRTNEPELIVLSDSSEDMEVPVAAQSPVLSHSHTKQSFTHLKPTESLTEKKQSRNLECSFGDLSQSPDQPNQGNCSPELSWLLPSTPVNSTPRRISLDSSTQTKVSMRKTELFPKESTRLGTVELNPERAEVASPVFAYFSSVSTHLHESSKQETPLQVCGDPYSSTPLHPHHRIRPDPTLPDAGPDTPKSLSQEHESPKKKQLEIVHPSPFPDPSEPHSSPAHRSVLSSERPSKCSSPNSAHANSHNSTGFKPTRRGTASEDGKVTELDDDHIEEATSDKSFEQSLLAMYEPSMAFNDSWGLNACDDVAGNPGGFSLRLEDSGGCSRPVDTAASSATSHSPTSYQDGASGDHEAKNRTSQPPTSKENQIFKPPTPRLITDIPPEISDSLLIANVWDSSEEEEEILPLSQRLKPSVQLKTTPPPRNKKHRTLVPITPMPHYSDMDTPELKNKLDRFGVRALPKRQMILKLKEIHQYTHQLVNSDSEDEAPCVGPVAQTEGAHSKSGGRHVALEQKVHFKDLAASFSPAKNTQEEEDVELPSNSQDSNASTATSSEESERHNPELCPSSGGDSDSDGGISASQAATRLEDRLQAVRSFILSDSSLYSQILHFQPLVLSQLQERLKAAGIRLGAAKLVNFLDSQCITFTTAKPGQAAPTRRRVRKTGKKAKAAAK
ncbi:structure-specific endonuclease subunit SLX4 isoform X2 [Hippocampus zosterae]|uniref:structure-specific endonuclease subunit SLX4 isoform X2 n=1 Tax=Hippocampus zosterae TaxID=109293 RepID=UPI00223DE6DF|nr:structure-specific endonuclease subunit SLX4 isoform X2 [Hippocampus zosterae]